MYATINITLTDEERHDILVTAIEGGINYWADVHAYRSQGVLVADLKDAEDEGAFDPVTLRAEHIQQGVDALCAKYSALDSNVRAILNGSVDAHCADAIVQMWLFGKITFA